MPGERDLRQLVITSMRFVRLASKVVIGVDESDIVTVVWNCDCHGAKAGSEHFLPEL